MSPVAIGLLVAAALAGAAALVLAIADGTTARSGTVTITINEEKQLVVPAGASLLATLKAERIFMPSACGGRGWCGLCKARVAGAAGEVLPAELARLSAEEVKAGFRLTCQVKVERDLRMYVPQSLLRAHQFAAKVAAMRDLTYDIKEVTLELVDPPEIDFVAGQFVQFEVPEYELARQPVYRAYSIASDPADRHTLALEIRLVPNGIATTYVHRFLKVGDAVTVNGPYGEFHLRDSDRPIVFIAGGSGMAAIRAMLFEMARTNSPRRATYFFGAKSRRDLFLVEEMRDFEARIPHFAFVPALSSPDREDSWDGETGLITDVVGRAIPSGADSEAYLCGSPGMINASVAVLKKNGVAEDRIFYDRFA